MPEPRRRNRPQLGLAALATAAAALGLSLASGCEPSGDGARGTRGSESLPGRVRDDALDVRDEAADYNQRLEDAAGDGSN